jgi:hypothetical protein
MLHPQCLDHLLPPLLLHRDNPPTLPVAAVRVMVGKVWRPVAGALTAAVPPQGTHMPVGRRPQGEG